MPPQMVSVCCDRLMTANAMVVIPWYPKPTPQFLQITTNYTRYWRRYVHTPSWCISGKTSVDELQEFANVMYNLDAPSLFELEIRHPRYAAGETNDERYRDAVHCYSTWSMPNLSSLITENIIPIPFASPVSLGSLSICICYWDMAKQDRGSFNMRALVTFITSCMVLKELALKLSFARNASWLVLPAEKHVSLDHVSEITLTFEYCHADVIKSILDVVHFPTASSMKLDIWSKNSSDSPPDELIDNVLLSIFPNALAFPKLVDLRLELGANMPGTSISLPFPSLSKVGHLKLKTTNTVLAPIPGGRCLPALRSLVMTDCKCLEVDWIALFLPVGRLKAQGNLQPLQLTVEGCRWKRSPPDIIPDDPISSIAWDRWDKEKYEKVTANEMLQLVM